MKELVHILNFACKKLCPRLRLSAQDTPGRLVFGGSGGLIKFANCMSDFSSEIII